MTIPASQTGAAAWNVQAASLLERTDRVLNGEMECPPADFKPPYGVGVDLGTAYTVLTVVNCDGQPVAGAYRFAQIVRDGLVVDFIGAVDLLRALRHQVEARTGLVLDSAATAYPPGVAAVEVRSTANVLEAAGLHCTAMLDEPTAANHILQLRDGAIVDVGGGTTGIAVLHEGQVVYTADEPTGGTHFTLTVAGALDLPFETAEQLKTDPAQQERLLPVVRPVMEKVASITQRHVQRAGVDVPAVYLVGGTARFAHMADVVQAYLGLPTCVPVSPMFVTPLGIAMHHLKNH